MTPNPEVSYFDPLDPDLRAYVRTMAVLELAYPRDRRSLGLARAVICRWSSIATSSVGEILRIK